VKQAIIGAVLAFFVSLGGTTGYLVKSYKPPVIPSDSLAVKADSSYADSAHADTASTGTQAAAVQDSAVSAIAGAPVRPTAAAGPTVAATGVTTDPIAKAGAYKQVARVLSAMKPPEAAKVIAFLSDDEVEGLLRSVGPRQAADFLMNIPKERAALLSRRLLTPKPAGATR
jgi:hypothetical protein